MRSVDRPSRAHALALAARPAAECRPSVAPKSSRCAKVQLADPKGSCRRRDSNPAPCCFAIRGRGGGCRVTCDACSPAVTARARREPAVPDAARTQRGPGSRAWKARQGSPLSRHASRMPQFSAPLNRPLLSVGNHKGPMLRAPRGHGRQVRPRSTHGGGGHQLDRKVSPSRVTTCLVGKPPSGGAAAGMVGIGPAVCCRWCRGPGGRRDAGGGRGSCWRVR
jgi:hypothetical protein